MIFSGASHHNLHMLNNIDGKLSVDGWCEKEQLTKI
jgi:hypothetical protein